MPDRTSGLSLLPVITKDKDDRTKEELHKPEKDSKMKDELHKLLNGNAVDSTDWVLQAFDVHICSSITSFTTLHFNHDKSQLPLCLGVDKPSYSLGLRCRQAFFLIYIFLIIAATMGPDERKAWRRPHAQ
jgi:hypothetical protein